jgi:acetyl esterase/lipase
MIYEKIDLYDYFKIAKKEGAKGILTVIAQTNSNEINKDRKYPAMLVIPGGGYAFVSDREAEPVALEYFNNNFCSFVLTYSVAPSFIYPVQITEAAMAMVYIKENSAKYNVSADKVAAIGFSAGGHLCGCLATLYSDENIVKTLGKDRAALVKPAAAVLSYPVISSDNKIWHDGSFIYVSNNNKKIMEYLSLENRVDKNSAPAFLWHTMEDSCVPVENSLVYAKKCKENGVPFELHIFEKGWHGLSLCNKKSDKLDVIEDFREADGEWFKLSVNWLKTRGICIKN